MNQTSDNSTQRSTNYCVEHVHRIVAAKFIPTISRTAITPNAVTLINMFNSVIIYWCIWNGKYLAVALLIQLLYFFDVIDGQLARYKNMTSKFGKFLDNFADTVFYITFYVLLGLKFNNGFVSIILYLLIYHLYAITATFYIVPSIKKICVFKRNGIKKKLMENGIILGMDVSMSNMLVTVLILTPFANMILYLISGMYFIDLIYRLIELSWNRRIEEAVKG